MEKIRAAKPIGGIRVTPTDDKYRKILKHPNGMGFRSEGSVEWPNDRFTKRRIAEGVIKAEKKPDEKTTSDEHHRRSRRHTETGEAAEQQQNRS